MRLQKLAQKVQGFHDYFSSSFLILCFPLPISNCFVLPFPSRFFSPLSSSNAIISLAVSPLPCLLRIPAISVCSSLPIIANLHITRNLWKDESSKRLRTNFENHFSDSNAIMTMTSQFDKLKLIFELIIVNFSL